MITSARLVSGLPNRASRGEFSKSRTDVTRDASIEFDKYTITSLRKERILRHVYKAPFFAGKVAASISGFLP